MRILEQNDIVQLLRSEVEEAGGQTAWAKKHGLERTAVNKVMHRGRPPYPRSRAADRCHL